MKFRLFAFECLALVWNCVVVAAVAIAIVAIADYVRADELQTQERVLTLPQDQAKWYISVVGDAHDVQYNEILGWFDSNSGLSNLKSQVKFCRVTTNTATYRERYAPNIKGVPTVRVQTSDGTVVYEASKKAIPKTANSLYEAIYVASSPKTCPDGGCPLWTRPSPPVVPEPQPLPDPDPQPIDDGGSPVFVEPVTPEEPASTDEAMAWVWILAVSLSVCVGAGVGIASQWRKTYGR